MKSFQKKHKQHIFLHQTKTHSQKRFVRPKYDPPPKKQKKQKSIRKIVSECHRTISSNHEFKEQLKCLIKLNEKYFRNKLEGRSNDLKSPKMKIPSMTGQTVYGKDYPKQIKQYERISKSQDYVDSKPIQTPFFGLTTYQTSYKQQQNKENIQKKLIQPTTDPNSPMSFLTQYKSNFKNWGKRQLFPLMNPHIKCSATGLQFEGSSSYKNEFLEKKPNRNDRLKKVPMQLSLQKRMKRPEKVAFLKTTNMKQFRSKKPINSKVNFRRSYETLNSGTKFKGKTEYKNEFVKMENTDDQRKVPTSEELQTLIMNL